MPDSLAIVSRAKYLMLGSLTEINFPSMVTMSYLRLSEAAFL